MGSNSTSRTEMEEFWRARLKADRQKYDCAVAEFSKVLAQQTKWPLPAPDGSAAVRIAGLQESAARNEYMRTLKIFTDLVVSGKAPEDHS